MKTKSKLVLGLSILSAATLAAGATSTFAWYQVTNNAQSTGKAAQYASLAVSQDTKTAGDLRFPMQAVVSFVGNNVTATDANKPAQMEMVEYTMVQSTATPRFGYYIKGENEPRYETSPFGGSSAVYWATLKVDVKVSGNSINQVTYTAAEAVNLLHDANQTFTLKVKPTEAFTATTADSEEAVAEYNAKYGGSVVWNESQHPTLPAVTASRAYLYDVDGQDAAAPASVGSAEIMTLANGVTVPATGTASGNDVIIATYYFGMYVNGAGQDFNGNGTKIVPNGNLSVYFE